MKIIVGQKHTITLGYIEDTLRRVLSSEEFESVSFTDTGDRLVQLAQLFATEPDLLVVTGSMYQPGVLDDPTEVERAIRQVAPNARLWLFSSLEWRRDGYEQIILNDGAKGLQQLVGLLVSALRS